MATQSKAQYLTEVHNLLKRRYKPSPSAQKLSVFESVVYGICHEGATRAQAEAAMEAFRSGFFDWNEVRVSPVAEIQGVFEKLGIPDTEERAYRLRRFLRQLFEKAYSFNLEPLLKKPQKDATKSLQEFEAFSSDFVLATVMRVGLGGHAIGIDRPTRRALERLGVAEPGQDDATLRGALERAVPKNRGIEFVDLIEDLAHDTCVEGVPDCPRCELRKICPSSRTRKPDPSTKAAAKAPQAASPSTAGKGSPTPPAPPSAKGKPGASAKAAAPAKPAPAPAVQARPARVAAKPGLSADQAARRRRSRPPAPKPAKVAAKPRRRPRPEARGAGQGRGAFEGQDGRQGPLQVGPRRTRQGRRQARQGQARPGQVIPDQTGSSDPRGGTGRRPAPARWT